MSANAGRVYAAVMLGSALGAVARFACSLAMLHLLGPGFPWGTLTVNGVGSFLIGLFAAVVVVGLPVTWTLTRVRLAEG